MGEQSTTATTVKSLSVQTIVTVIQTVISLASFSIMSRLLTKDDFGYYAVISAITAIFYTLTEAGFGSAVIQKKDVTKSYYDTAFSLSLYTGVVFSVVLFLGSGLIAKLFADESLATPLKVMSICVLFCSLNSVTKANMTRKLAFAQIGRYTIYGHIIGMVLGVTAAYFHYGVYSIIIQNVFGQVFTFCIFYFNLEIKPKWFNVERKSVREIVSYGGWLTASCIFRTIYQQVDKLLTGKWFSMAVLGAYNRPAGFITEISSKFTGILDTVLFPILSSFQDDKDKTKRAYDGLIHSSNLLSGIICSLCIISNKWIIDIFFGKDWESISTIFCILSLYLLLSVNGRIMDCFIRSLAFVKMGFYLRILACVITISCLFLGKEYGLVGIAMAMVVSNYLIILTKMLYVGYKIEITFLHTMKTMLKPLLCAVPKIISFILFHEQICGDMLWSILATLFACLYYIVLFAIFPRLLGDYALGLLKNKFPQLKILKR